MSLLSRKLYILLQKTYYTELARFSSLVTQPGPPLDTLSNISLGVGGSDPDGILTVNSVGEVTINKSGPFMVKQVFNLARQGVPGNVEAFFQAQISLDGGSSWASIGSSLNRRVADGNSISVFFDVSPIFLEAGAIVRNQWCQSSVGGDPSDPTSGLADGELLYSEPSPLLRSAGVNPTPSASAVFYGIASYPY